MSDDFQAGDLVEMKTGSPEMIYVAKTSGGDAMCEWFDGQDRKVKREVIHVTSLRKISSR